MSIGDRASRRPEATTQEVVGSEPEVRGPLVIVGPTGSGKSALAVDVAVAEIELGHRVEIVSVDAMAVYREMDIGTAAPDRESRRGVPHHMIGVADPSEDYTVARFQIECLEAIGQIEGRGATPLLVGGTGLYVQAVVDDLTIPGQYPAVRAQLEETPDTITLWARLRELDPVAAARMEPTNRRRVVRALEVCLGSGQPFSSFGPGINAFPPTRFCLVGLEADRAAMDERIERRYDLQMAAGFLPEVRRLLERPAGLSPTARQALGYRELIAHLTGECTLEEALEEARRRTRRFARRQQRWFRRDPRIHWVDIDRVRSGSEPSVVDEVRKRWGEQAD